jgi:hypothetical protein
MVIFIFRSFSYRRREETIYVDINKYHLRQKGRLAEAISYHVFILISFSYRRREEGPRYSV